jgi:hypothetical protein
MKHIYATNPLQEPVKFTISDNLLEKIKKTQLSLQSIPLEEGMVLKAEIDIPDELNESLTEPYDTATIIITPDKISFYIFQGPFGTKLITNDLLSCPDVFIMDEFRTLYYEEFKQQIEKSFN